MDKFKEFDTSILRIFRQTREKLFSVILLGSCPYRNRMDIYDFNRLTPEQRITLIRKQGKFLAVRLKDECHVCLYGVEKFFAEVWYRTRDNKVELVIGFTSKTLLEPYLELGDLTDLT